MHIEIRAGATVKIQFPESWTQTGSSGAAILNVDRDNEINFSGLGTGAYTIDFDTGGGDTLTVNVVAS